VMTVFRQIWRPYSTTLVRVADVPGMHDRASHPDAAFIAGCPVFRFDAPLIFANAPTFRHEVLALAAQSPAPRWIVVAAEPINAIDITAVDMLVDLVGELEAGGTSLHFAELKSRVRADAERMGLARVMDADHFHPLVDDAMDDFARLP